MAPHSSTLPGKSHGWRSLVGCSAWGPYELDTTERLHFHFSLSCIGEGNGNPLQCSCLDNPMDGGSWWLPSVGSHGVGHDWSDLAAAWYQTLRTPVMSKNRLLQICLHSSRYWNISPFCARPLHLLFLLSRKCSLSSPFSIPDFTSQHLPAIRFQINHHLFKDILSDFNLDPPVRSYYSDIPSSKHLTTFYVSICVVIWLIPVFPTRKLQELPSLVLLTIISLWCLAGAPQWIEWIHE